VPGSPTSMTGPRFAAACLARSLTSAIAGQSPTITPSPAGT